MTAAVRYRVWLSMLATRESNAITQDYAYPPRAPLSAEEHARVTHLFELGQRAYDDALAIEGIHRDDDAAAEMWRAARDAM